VKRPSATFTAQMLERASPPMPSSVVAEASSLWCATISFA